MHACETRASGRWTVCLFVYYSFVCLVVWLRPKPGSLRLHTVRTDPCITWVQAPSRRARYHRGRTDWSGGSSNVQKLGEGYSPSTKGKAKQRGAQARAETQEKGEFIEWKRDLGDHWAKPPRPPRPVAHPLIHAVGQPDPARTMIGAAGHAAHKTLISDISRNTWGGA